MKSLKSLVLVSLLAASSASFAGDCFNTCRVAKPCGVVKTTCYKPCRPACKPVRYYYRCAKVCNPCNTCYRVVRPACSPCGGAYVVRWY